MAVLLKCAPDQKEFDQYVETIDYLKRYEPGKNLPAPNLRDGSYRDGIVPPPDKNEGRGR